jgi:hypothetical protein
MIKIKYQDGYIRLRSADVVIAVHTISDAEDHYGLTLVFQGGGSANYGFDSGSQRTAAINLLGFGDV